jgi:hypothetical protein
MNTVDALDPGALVAVCPSCWSVHPDRFRCACVITRSELLARFGHEVARIGAPAWRRPRSWEALPHGVRQDRTMAALEVVEALERAGWRLVAVSGKPRHGTDEHGPDDVERELEPITDQMSPVRDVVR